jgi:hypothetical protein
VRRALVDLAILAVVATLVLALALVFQWTSTERSVDAYLVALGALSMLGLLQATREAAPPPGRSAFEDALRRRRPQEPSLPQLERVRRETSLAIARAFDFHVRLRPTLREIAAQRLARRRALDLDGQPDAARAVLGDEAWELLRADRSPPEDRFSRGVDPSALSRLLDTLERI